MVSLQANFNKTYNSPAEESLRRNVFMQNFKLIVNHNLKFRQGTTTFEMGINQFADRRFDEFLSIFIGNETITMDSSELDSQQFKPLEVYGVTHDVDMPVPPSFDWRVKGAVTRVKNQLTCGACYAMAAIGAIESQNFIVKGKLKSLSEQEIVDCGQSFLTLGCMGGVDYKVFDYIKANQGISTDRDYPFKGKAGECQKIGKKASINLEGYGIVSSRENLEIVKRALISKGPLMISLDFNHESFMRYSRGVYYDDDCSNVNMEHSALLVGYGSDKGEDFWIVKNSFGESWGEKGFIRMAMSRGGNCGVSSYPIFPIIKNVGTKHKKH
jgi:cathepsin L